MIYSKLAQAAAAHTYILVQSSLYIMKALLPLLVCAAAPACAVHHFKELNRFRDLEQLGVIGSSSDGRLIWPFGCLDFARVFIASLLLLLQKNSPAAH